MSNFETGPALDFEPVTPSNTVNLHRKTRTLYVGTGGNVSVQNAAGVAVVFVGVPSGTKLPLYTIRVNATGTTATDIVAMY